MVPNCKDSVFIYARISRDDKYANIETIKSQIELLKSYVTRQLLGQICGIYADDNVSGSTFERPELNALKKQVSAGEVDVLVVKDLSRLGRNNAITLLFLDWLEEHGVRIVSTDGRYDSKQDNELAGLETWYNERYIRDISAKTRASIRHKQEQGLHLAKAPYGFQKDPKNKYLLIKNLEEAVVVEGIFSAYLNGETPTYIAEKLFNEGHKTPGGLPPKEWNSTMVRRILQNQAYVGNTVSGKTRRVSFKNKRVLLVPKEEQLQKENTHEPIICKEVFDAAGKLLKSKGVYSRKEKCLKVLCGDCGKPMYRRRTGDGFGYVCSTYTRFGSNKCDRHYFKEEVLKKEIAQALKGVIKKNFDLTVNGLELLSNEKYGKAIKEAEKAQKKLEISYQDYLEGIIEKEFYVRLKKELSNQIDGLNLMDSGGDAVSELNKLMKNKDFIKFVDNETIEQFVNEIHIYNQNNATKNRQDVGTIAVVSLEF